MAEKVCHVFISHRHEDDAELKAMKDLLAKNGCSARDSSVNSSTPNDARDPDYIKAEILAPRIQWAGTVVVLISPGTHESTWVDWEIEYANKLGKRIVGVWAHGAKDCDAPAALEEFASAVVGWQADRIIDAIFGKINNWETVSGETRAIREIARYNC
ncbi:MAG: TIR domain-containing protein [Thermoanaerobaculia bacterium]